MGHVMPSSLPCEFWSLSTHKVNRINWFVENFIYVILFSLNYTLLVLCEIVFNIVFINCLYYRAAIHSHSYSLPFPSMIVDNILMTLLAVMCLLKQKRRSNIHLLLPFERFFSLTTLRQSFASKKGHSQFLLITIIKQTTLEMDIARILTQIFSEIHQDVIIDHSTYWDIFYTHLMFFFKIFQHSTNCKLSWKIIFLEIFTSRTTGLDKRSNVPIKLLQ